MRRFLFLSLALLAGIVGIDAVFCGFTLHVPHRESGAAPPEAVDAMIRARDGAKLAAWFVPASKSAGRCVIVLHGIGDSRRGSAGYLSLFRDAGYSVLLPDSRGHGSSGGDLVTYGLLEKYDVLAWTSWMRDQGCNAIYGLGESLGGAILIQSASLQPVFRAIVAECAYSDLRSIARYRVMQMTGVPESIANPLVVQSAVLYARVRYGLDLSTVSPLESIRKTTTPVFLIHGLADGRTPPWHSQRLAEANHGAKLWLVPGADHVSAYSTAPQEFRKRVLDWFANH